MRGGFSLLIDQRQITFDDGVLSECGQLLRPGKRARGQHAFDRIGQRLAIQLAQTDRQRAGQDFRRASGQLVLATGVPQASASTSTLPNPS